jgi:hypothetical protein
MEHLQLQALVPSQTTSAVRVWRLVKQRIVHRIPPQSLVVLNSVVMNNTLVLVVLAASTMGITTPRQLLAYRHKNTMPTRRITTAA